MTIPFALWLFPLLVASQEKETVNVRWRYASSRGPKEKRMHSEKIKQIDAWWNEFQSKTADLDNNFSRKSKWDVAGWMQQNLQAIDPNLMWEFGPAVKAEGHRLVITSENRRDLRPLVGAILVRGPKLKGWEFYPYRLPEDYEKALETVKARTSGDISRTSFTAALNKFNMVDLVFYSKKYDSEKARDAGQNDALVAIETLLGEEILDKWVGTIDAEVLKRANSKPAHIKTLRASVEALIAKAKAGLPDQPYYRFPEETNWTLYELEPKDRQEYPRQTDMLLGTSMVPALVENAHEGRAFDSIRFSKNGETFCYVKIDGDGRSPKEMYKERSGLEDALDQALKRAKIGCVIGGGTGKKYLYLDLALTDVHKGTEVARKVLREGEVNKRSWVQFFDDDLAAEWVGIWEDAPPPPMQDFDSDE